MELLTIFTPTYNRSALLTRCYISLKEQTCKSFVWIIVDDGSSDNTESVVKEWIENEKEFKIQYFYKENGGLHTAYNLAIEHLETELAVCIDSDDYMPENAVEIITDFWKKNRDNSYAGITGLDYYAGTDKIVGGAYPENQKSINLIDLLVGRYPSSYGDKKHVVRSELYKQVAPMKSFPGEKFFNPHYMHLEISKKYDFLILNKNFCFVDYQDSGMTNNMYRQYYNSPNSFAEIRLHYMSFPNLPFKFKLKSCVHYISSCILAGRKDNIGKFPYKMITVLCFPFGFALSRVVIMKNKE